MSDFLTPKQIKFVAAWNGNATEAARAAGYKFPEHNAAKVANIPKVKRALEEKERSFNKQVGKKAASGVVCNRNHIINGLYALATGAENEGARVSAFGHLKDIFGLNARNDKDTDIFAGWSKEELDEYARTGELPDRFGSGDAPSAGETSSAQPGTD